MSDELPDGTVRRAPTPGFAHAIKLDQGPGATLVWQVIDAYGPWELVDDDYVRHWPVVYVPVGDSQWEGKVRQARAYQHDKPRYRIVDNMGLYIHPVFSMERVRELIAGHPSHIRGKPVIQKTWPALPAPEWVEIDMTEDE